MAITLYWGSGSAFSWRVLLALEHKRLPYESQLLHFDKQEPQSPQMLKMNPRGRVPVLKDNDYVVFESVAVLYYLDQKYPQIPIFGLSPEAVLEAEQGTEDVGVEGGCVALGGLIDDEAGLPFGAGDVDSHVEAAESGHCLVDQTPDFFVVPYIGLDEEGLRAEALQFDFQGLALGQAATINN